VALPEHVQVRISSEAAGAITMTPVVNQTIPMRELVEIVLGSSGKDPRRVAEVLLRGAVVQGASRFRWQPVDAAPGDLAMLLAGFPEADPSRPFRHDQCVGVRLRAGVQVLELPREIAEARRLLKRRSFWDELMALGLRSKLEYVDYSYRLRADEYRLRLAPADLALLRAAASLLRHSGLAASILETHHELLEYVVRRV
jgi:hypothetical protein